MTRWNYASVLLFWVFAAAIVRAEDFRGETVDGLPLEQLNQVCQQAWQENQVQPTPAVDDLAFLRRVWLDLAGRIPPLKETRAALEAKNPLDRAALVERLLASDEFANHWGRQWTQYLTDARPFEADTHNGRLLQNYLRDAIQANEPYDQIVRALFTDDGPSDTSGPVNFLLRYNVTPAVLTGAAAEKFLGVTLKCAECHDHPHSSWRQSEFWGVAAYFARLRKMTPTEGDDFSIVVERSRGELEVPDKSAKQDENGEYPVKAIFPRLPGGVSIDATPSRRDSFLNWLTARDNPFFARHVVNHVWEMLLGSPLMATLDPAKGETANSIPPALDVLANDFAGHGFDLQRLIRTIVLSEVYQRSAGQAVSDAETIEDNVSRKEIEFFARFAIRPLSVDQLHLSLAIATGSAGDSDDARLAQVTREEYTYDFPLEAFSDPAMTPRRSLALLNSERAREAVSLAAESAMRQCGPSPGPEHIDWLFLSILSRPPRAEERDHLLELSGASAGEAGLQDAAWVLINSAEFNSNH